MTDSDRRGKRRPTVVEGFNNVPNILEEARRAVDDVTQAVQNQGGGGETPAAPEGRKGGGAGPKRRKAAPRKKSAKEGGRPEKAFPAPCPQGTTGGPRRGCGLGPLRRAAAWLGGLRHHGETCHPRAHSLAPLPNAAQRGPGRKAPIPAWPPCPGLLQWRPAPTPVPCSSLLTPGNWLRSMVVKIWPGLCTSFSRGSIRRV